MENKVDKNDSKNKRKMKLEEKLQEDGKVERSHLFQFKDFVPFYGFINMLDLLESITSEDVSKKRRAPLESKYPELSTLIEASYLITLLSYQISSSFLIGYGIMYEIFKN